MAEIVTRPVAGYGWTPDLPDARDLQFAVAPEVVKVLPPKVDLREQCPPVYDQGQPGPARRTRSAEPSSSTS